MKAKYGLWGILLLAAALRLGLALAVPDSFGMRADAAEYIAVAQNWLQTGVFGENAGIPYAVIPPAFPAFLAAIFAATGGSLLAVRLAQALLGVGVVWLTYRLTRELLSEREGLLAAGLAAIYPPLVLYVTFYLTETLYTCCALLFFYGCARWFAQPRARLAALAGAGFALALLTRETLIILPLAFPLLFWWGRIGWRAGLRFLLVFTGVALLCLTPWLARNARTFGVVFFTERTDALRFSLTGAGYLSSEFQTWVRENEAPLAEDARNYAYLLYYGRAADMRSPAYLLAHPGDYVTFLGRRLAEFWLHPVGLESLPHVLVLQGGYVAFHAVLVGLAAWGMAALAGRRNAGILLHLLTLLIITGIGLFLRRPLPRYTLPFIPLLLLFTAHTLTHNQRPFFRKPPHVAS
ncbi:MAG: glycosyltransferase family 39 protein [Ardenticatenales bacterium]|nr:glycosyltransferase family 39 protein [Ardenticatenales bacterium]